MRRSIPSDVWRRFWSTLPPTAARPPRQARNECGGAIAGLKAEECERDDAKGRKGDDRLWKIEIEEPAQRR
jgi:hypothetical protein